MPNPYAPDEPHSQIVAEEMWLQGALLSNIVYGIELTLFAICFKLLVQQTSRANYKRQTILLTFITILFILGTLFVYSLSDMTQLSFIEDRNYPGGPAQYEVAMFWIPVDELGVVALVIGNWLMDSLMVWRCLVVFSGISRAPLRIVMALPCLLIAASVGLGTLFLVKTSRSSPFNAVYVTLPYFATTLALNLIVTTLIVSRLLYCRWRFARILGAEHVSHYAYLAAILAEPASLYSAFSILFLVPLAMNNPLSSVFLQAMSQVQTVSSLLIILHVATGRALAERTATQMMSIPGPDAIRLRNLSPNDLGPTSSSKAETSKVGIMVSQEVFRDLGESAV